MTLNNTVNTNTCNIQLNVGKHDGNHHFHTIRIMIHPPVILFSDGEKERLLLCDTEAIPILPDVYGWLVIDQY